MNKSNTTNAINKILPKRVIGVLIMAVLSLLPYRVVSSTVDKTNYSNNLHDLNEKTTTTVNPIVNKNEPQADVNKINKTNKEKENIKNGVQFDVNKITQITEQLDLSPEQQLNIIKAFKIGSTIVAEDGTNFGLTLASIMGQESSYGLKLFNTKTFHKTKSSLGAFQIHLQTAREVIDEFDVIAGKNLNDNQLAYKLAHDFEFGATIASLYLKKNYEEAHIKSFKNPWRGAVSKYNGGWDNPTYISSIQDEMKTVKEFLKIMNIKG